MIRLLFIGRPSREKGLFVLMHALIYLKPGSFSLSIVGEKPTEFRVRHQRLHAQHIHCLGCLPNKRLPVILRQHDLLIIPSLYENFGNVALEAMACGVPVIASDTGGLSELVHSGGGRLFPPGNHRVLASRISILKRMNGQRVHMGNVAAIRARRYGWPEIGSKVSLLLEKISSKNTSSCEK